MKVIVDRSKLKKKIRIEKENYFWSREKSQPVADPKAVANATENVKLPSPTRSMSWELL